MTTPTPNNSVASSLLQMVDSIKFYEEEDARLTTVIDTERAAENDEYEVSPAAFVTFTSQLTAAKASQLWHVPDRWRVEQAPEPYDVYWPNLRMSERERSARGLCVTAASAALVFGWVFPVAFIASLTALDNLTNTFKFLKGPIENSPVLKGIVTGLVPAAALLALMSLLPIITLKLSMLEGLHSWSLLERAQLSKLYYFEMINTFFVVALAGAVFAKIMEIVERPGSVFDLLGQSIPAVSTFFISYVAMRALIALPMELLRGPFFMLSIIWKRRAVTKDELCEADEPTTPRFGEWYSRQLLVFSLALIYSVNAPLMVPFAALYFAMAYIVYAYQLIFVYRTHFETNGQFWPLAFSRMVAGMFIWQVMMIGLLSLKKGFAQSPLLLPLPVITLLFYRECHGRYLRASEVDPLSANVPREEAPRDIAFLDSAYVHPCLRPELDEVDPVPVTGLARCLGADYLYAARIPTNYLPPADEEAPEKHGKCDPATGLCPDPPLADGMHGMPCSDLYVAEAATTAAAVAVAAVTLSAAHGAALCAAPPSPSRYPQRRSDTRTSLQLAAQQQQGKGEGKGDAGTVERGDAALPLPRRSPRSSESGGDGPADEIAAASSGDDAASDALRRVGSQGRTDRALAALADAELAFAQAPVYHHDPPAAPRCVLRETCDPNAAIMTQG